MTAALIAFGVALALLLHAATTRAQETRLRRRLRPIEARLIDPGRSAQHDIAGALTTQTDDDHLPAVTTSFTGRWRYSVDGRDYEGATSLDVPVFADADVRFGRVQVFYDPENPSFSTARPGHRDQARAWFIAAGVVLAGAVGLALIGHAANQPPAAPRGR